MKPEQVCFREERKEGSESAVRIDRGRVFQIEGAAKVKERSPKRIVFVGGTINVRVSVEERRGLSGVLSLRRSDR